MMPLCVVPPSRKRTRVTSGFEWLLHEQAVEQPLNAGPTFAVDDDRWSGTLERIVVSPTLHISLNNVRARRDFGVQPTDRYDEPYVVGQVMLDGRVDLAFDDGSRVVASANHSLLFRLSAQWPTYNLRADTPFHSLAYKLDVARIERLLEGEAPEILRPLLARELDQPVHLSGRVNRLMRNIAAGTFATRLNGPLRLIMLEGAALQLFAIQAGFAARQEPLRERIALSNRERAAVHDAHDRLLADMREPPTLGMLADAVGLSEKRLSAGFRQEFGASVFETLRNRRLEHARQALEDGAANVKEIAHRVGYNHVSNFIHAYRARYGKPPRRHLRQEREELAAAE
jgi:AraC-like DNA-binding protein